MVPRPIRSAALTWWPGVRGHHTPLPLTKPPARRLWLPLRVQRGGNKDAHRSEAGSEDDLADFHERPMKPLPVRALPLCSCSSCLPLLAPAPLPPASNLIQRVDQVVQRGGLWPWQLTGQHLFGPTLCPAPLHPLPTAAPARGPAGAGVSDQQGHRH